MTRSVALLVITLASASGLPATPAALGHLGQQTPDVYRREIEAWRAVHEAGLRADDGWLTVVGLHWLKSGVSRVGGSPAADVPLPPGSAPKAVGTMTVERGIVRFAPEPGVDVRINGAPARPQVLKPQPGDYDTVTSGSVTFFIIKRGDRLGVRVRDAKSALRREFAGLRWYPVRDDCRVTARFIPSPGPASIMIANVLGAVDPWPTPGRVVFTLNGRELTLHPVLDGPDAKELFFIFRDGTTGSDTYPGGRFLYAPMPKNGEVVLDFNKAESPPCAFTAFATCPLPPRENALPVRIEAGERNPHR